MESLVFLEPNKLDAEPFTTSKVISEFSGVEHRKLKAAIRKHRTAIEAFGILAPYEADIQGRGRGQPETIYKLNEQQAYFLMTLLKNTPVVVAFKQRLVYSFFLMRRELSARQLERALGKPIRRTLTDAVRDSGEDDRMHGHAYGAYTDLAYKAATGKIARVLRKERGAAKDSAATDFLTSDELQAYHRAEERLAMLLDMGLGYHQIKALLPLRAGKALAG